MTDSEDKRIFKLAVQVALASRHETFIAHYPRKLKLAVVGIPVLALLVFSFMNGKNAPVALEAPHATTLESAATHEGEREIAGSADHQAVSESRLPSSRLRNRLDPPTAAQQAAMARNDNYDNKAGMPAAPDSAFVEARTTGLLPKIASDGRKPWEYYARPFDLLDPRPRIALVMVDLGLSRIATDAAIHRLPAPVTLAFDVQGSAIKDWLERARLDGHETILSLPMEPVDYPRNDPGPGTLLMSLSNSENIQRLLNFLSVGSGYVGVTTLSGSRFLGDPQKVSPVLDVMEERGLLVLDAEVSQHSSLADLAKEKKVPFTVNTLVLDETPTPQAIDEALARLEKMAQTRGNVVAIASPLPLTLERLTPWLKNLSSHGIALAPLSAVVVQ